MCGRRRRDRARCTRSRQLQRADSTSSGSCRDREHARRPRDQARATSSRRMNGKTIEVINTDAEGRLILADALVVRAAARRDAPGRRRDAHRRLVVALGHARQRPDRHARTTGSNACAPSATRAGERCWPMPLYDEYQRAAPQRRRRHEEHRRTARRRLHRGAASCGSSPADLPWAHLDIAGTAWADGKPWPAEGPDRVAVRTLAGARVHYRVLGRAADSSFRLPAGSDGSCTRPAARWGLLGGCPHLALRPSRHGRSAVSRGSADSRAITLARSLRGAGRQHRRVDVDLGDARFVDWLFRAEPCWADSSGGGSRSNCSVPESDRRTSRGPESDARVGAVIARHRVVALQSPAGNWDRVEERLGDLLPVGLGLEQGAVLFVGHE